MCLSIAINHPKTVLSQGTHRGFEFVTVHNGMGYRCGYVRVPNGHPWHGKGYDAVSADVHGGLTFADADMPCGKGGADDGTWFGFDCAHCGDAPDPQLPLDHPVYGEGNRYLDGTVCDQEYVESECRKLADQAADAAKI